jgi:hypothetical protein
MGTPRPEESLVRRLLTLIVVLVLLLVVADRVAWYVAERGVATAIQQSEDLPQQPDVSIGGFPFLTQAWKGVYDDVDVKFRDVPAPEAGVDVEKLDAHLRGVHIPLKDVVDRNVQRAPVDAAAATGWVSFATLDAATAHQIPSSQVTVHYGPGSAPDRVSVTGTYHGPTGNVQLKGEARLEAQDGSLVVTIVPESLNLPPLVRNAVARLLGLTYRVPDLPFGFQVRSVAVGKAGVSATATAKNVVLGPVADAS